MMSRQRSPVIEPFQSREVRSNHSFNRCRMDIFEIAIALDILPQVARYGAKVFIQLNI
jgi:hypothetical protein